MFQTRGAYSEKSKNKISGILGSTLWVQGEWARQDTRRVAPGPGTRRLREIQGQPQTNCHSDKRGGRGAPREKT